MTRPSDLNSIITRIKRKVCDVNGVDVDLSNLKDDLEVMLTTVSGLIYVKQHSEFFEQVLTLFAKMIFADDIDMAKWCFKHVAVVTDIFLTKLPKIRESAWWKQFENDIADRIPKLIPTIAHSDGSWVDKWIFMANLIVSTPSLSRVHLNLLLNVTETAFRKGKEEPEVLVQAWTCWDSLVSAFGRCPNLLAPSRTLTLLLKPLQVCQTPSELRITTWVHLIGVKALHATEDALKQLVGGLCSAMYRAPEDKAVSRHFPDKCAATLADLITNEPVREHCLADIVNEFGSCVKSRPSPDLIDRLSHALVAAINSCADDGLSYKLWTTLVDQYKTCLTSPVGGKQVSSILTEVNFHRWVDAGTIDGKDINAFMIDADFRGEVLVRSIRSLLEDDHDVASVTESLKKKQKPKPTKSAWINYSEAYLSWWSSENEEATAHEKADYEATLALVLHPLRAPSWSPTIYKTWSLLCEACHKQRLLISMAGQICEALDSQDFQWQKAIDVLNFLCSLDGELCKKSGKILDKISPYVICMEMKPLMDLLLTLEATACFSETSPAIGKILKIINEKYAEFEQLNAHKVRTKVGKIVRKMEQASSAEKEKSGNVQRTPFRTHSNFLHRLAKAEEKNKTKSPYLTSLFGSSGKNYCDKTTGEPAVGDARSSQESATNESDDSDNVHIVKPLVSPTTLNQINAASAVVVSTTVAEKENVNFLSSASPPLIPSPGSKLKITNARELKTIDATSPSVRKVKPMAGQKPTTKKTTPSKVSYFDDDATDCVMVPPKQKTTPLTEHQREMMTKRRSDIPALYQDLSQDTQTSVDPPSAVVVSHSLPDAEMVPDTLSPPPAFPLLATPERPHFTGKTSSSKKLDFNNVQSTPPNDAHNPPALETCQTKNSSPNLDDTPKSTPGCASGPLDSGDPSNLPNGEQRARRRKKLGPIKYSPKATRSRRSLQSEKPTNIVDPEIKTAEPNGTGSQPPISVEDIGKDAAEEPPLATVLSTSEDATSGPPAAEETEPFAGDAPKTPDSALNDEKKHRKRKSVADECTNIKKIKLPDRDSDCVSSKKLIKKKRKSFTLCTGNNNLESWLVKTDKVVDNGEAAGGADRADDKEDWNNSEDIVPSTQELSVLVEDVAPSPSPTKIRLDEVADVLNDMMPKRADDEQPARKTNESPDDAIELIITSPSKRQRRATSVMRGEGDAAPNKKPAECAQEADKDQLAKRPAARQKSRRHCSTLTQGMKSLHAPGGRSAKMLRLAASSSLQDGETTGLLTPTRKRESIAPVTFGECWPTGQIEDWVAFTPVSPFSNSPYRSALKKTPLTGDPDEFGTPKMSSKYSLASPHTSSAKRKRVGFLDPPVTTGLLFERNTSFGSIHLANVPTGSPYPTWKKEDESAAESDVVFDESVSSVVADVVSNEVRILIDPSSVDAATYDERLKRLISDLQLDDTLIGTFTTASPLVQSLILDSLESVDMERTVDGWKISECLQICQLPRTFLASVRNSKAEVLSDVLTVATSKLASPPPQTTQALQTDTPLLCNAHAQATVPTIHATTMTAGISTDTSSTQADFQLPSVDELLPLIESLGHQRSLLFLSDFTRLLCSLGDT